MAAMASLILLVGIAGCGYHTAGHAVTLPQNVKVLAVPGFTNQSQTFRIEQALTQAVVHEFTTRTHYQIVNQASDMADATLRGTVLTTATSPLTYDSKTGRAESVLVVVSMKVTLTDRDGKILFQNPAYAFREQYQVSRSCRASSRKIPRRWGGCRGTSRKPWSQCYGGLLVRAFAQADRFVSDVEARKLRRVTCLWATKRSSASVAATRFGAPDPADVRELQRGMTWIWRKSDLPQVLDRARTPSLMAPFQVFFVRGVKSSLHSRHRTMMSSRRSRTTSRIRTRMRCVVLWPTTSAFRPTFAGWICRTRTATRGFAKRWDHSAGCVELARVEESDACAGVASATARAA